MEANSPRVAILPSERVNRNRAAQILEEASIGYSRTVGVQNSHTGHCIADMAQTRCCGLSFHSRVYLRLRDSLSSALLPNRACVGLCQSGSAFFRGSI